MKIRSITVFMDPEWPLKEEILRSAARFIEAARPAITSAGYEVQTTRLATPPFPRLFPVWNADGVVRLAQTLDKLITALGFDYLSLGPALPGVPQSYPVIPEMLAATENVFLSGVIADFQNGVSLPAIQACSEIIQQAATLDPNGFGNLFFAALANVPPGVPFFPAAYHAGGAPTFALATQSADLAVDAFTGASSLQAARQDLIAAVERHGRVLSGLSQDLADQTGLFFGGIDFTLAPFPEEAASIGTAIERLGVPSMGLQGSLAAAAILTDTLDQAHFPRAGLNGLMFPVMEDAVLAASAANGRLSVTDLLLYSTVCGTGLDTVPLPGTVETDQLSAVLLDLATLAQRLSKPLTARLMPIPGKRAGEPTGFDFPYFANSRVLALTAEPLMGLMAGDEAFLLSRQD